MSTPRRRTGEHIDAPLLIDVQELEAFRSTLPVHRQFEKYRILILQWDIVRAQYLVQKYPREQVMVNVTQAAQIFGFPTQDSAVTNEDGQERPFNGFYSVDSKAAMSEQTDLERPVLLAQMLLPGDATLSRIFIDGLHRLYKASRLGREQLPCYMLTPEEERACRY